MVENPRNSRRFSPSKVSRYTVLSSRWLSTQCHHKINTYKHARYLVILYAVEVAIEDVSEGSNQNQQVLLSSGKSCGHSCEAESQALCCICTVEQRAVQATEEDDNIVRALSNCSLCQRLAGHPNEYYYLSYCRLGEGEGGFPTQR